MGPVMTNFDGKTSSVQAESILQLNFSLSHQNGADQLLLNGLQIYPIDPTSQSFMEPLTASQMIKTSDDTWQYASNPKLGYSLGISRKASSPQDQLDLVAVHLEIVEVADKFIKGLPAIDLQLLETPSGKLMLGNSGITAPASLSNPTDDDRECTTLLCKWRAIVADRLAALKKGCGSKRPTPEVRPVFVPMDLTAHGAITTDTAVSPDSSVESSSMSWCQFSSALWLASLLALSAWWLDTSSCLHGVCSSVVDKTRPGMRKSSRRRLMRSLRMNRRVSSRLRAHLLNMRMLW